MTHLHYERIAKIPYATAKRFLRERFVALVERGPIDRVELEAGPLRHGVDVKYSRGKDPMHFDEPWSVYWEPRGGGPYPVFNGTLTARADETYESSILELDGHYDPPLGTVGKAFDAVLGRRIAESTADNLLTRIASEMERTFMDEESAKPPRDSAGSI